MRIQDLEGVVAILPTPLTEDGDLDDEGLRYLVRHCVEAGLDGVVVLGSNGEFAYLSSSEKRRVMGVAAEAAGGRIPVIGTASATATERAVALARSAKEVGCSAVMAAVPSYWRVGADDAREHMAAIAREGGLPVFFYYFPEVTGTILRPEEIASIAALDGVVGAKVTVSNVRFLRELIRRTRSHDWRVFTGTSFLLHACRSAGGAGVFCPLPLLVPALVRELDRASRSGERDRALRIQKRLLRAIPLSSGIGRAPALQALGFSLLSRAPYRGPGARPAPPHALLKEALRQRRHPISGMVRRPHRPADASQRELVRRTLARLDRT